MSTPEPVVARHTPLHDRHVALGAVRTDFAGWSMPLRYGSESAEHRAVRTAAGLFDLSHMGEIELTGPQALDAADHALVSNLTRLRVGGAKYTLLCAEDGGIIDDLIVYRLAEQRLLVVANAANTDVVVDELTRRSAGFDAAVLDRRAEYALVAVQGPASVAVLAGSVEAELDGVRYYAATSTRVGGVPALLARTGYTGEDGFEVFCAAQDAVTVWDRLTEAGAGHGLVPAGLACRDTLRLEAGMPLYGHELTRRTSPYAAHLGRVVALDHPGFVGHDALAERARTGEPRVLAGLVLDGRRPARAGHPVHAVHPPTDGPGDGPQLGPEIGEVTSGAPSPTVGHPIAMAYLDAGYAEPGDGAPRRVVVDVRGRPEPARVVALPFYRRPR